jgi:Zn-dependent protease with chaperone function
MAAGGAVLAVLAIGIASSACAEGITWQVTRQTHLTRFHELRLGRLDPRFMRTARKRPEAELADDVRAANQYTPGEKTMRAEILVAFAAGFAAVLGVLLWAFGSSATRRVLAMCGAHPADDTAREAQCMLEALAVRADTSIPNLYVMESELAEIFSLGLTPDHSSIAVTRGLLDLLDERELEAILAHELSHIAHHDTMPATVVTWYKMLIRRPKLPAPSAVARATERADLELLADADAVRLTGDPEGLRRALRKLPQDRLAGRLQTLIEAW